ncbi:TlpA disulfide reductase family protein [Alteromonas gilva]|uniref:TlpA disulfide reductase family protein n=1 Tax=Alteromonas gilva TaxID=2987522 RepID=A0ABT5KYY4_9ALTE|nr:TlpA disulfide reductase family protein [Alteromonas gilva]MDC8829979.1 TlpA disulfide reductase family protein [Alteromonas gilva]
MSIGPLGLAIDYALVWGALLLSLLIVRWVTKQKRLRQATENTLLTLFVVALVGARAGFVWRMWDQYSTQIWSIFDIRDGGFLPHTGLVAAALILMVKIKNNPLIYKPVITTIGLTALCIMPVYVGVNLYNQTERIPALTLLDIQGEVVSLTSFDDKPVVINVWATWCPPCQREMPVLANAQQQYQDTHFIFINQAESAKQVQDFFSAQQLQLENVLLDKHGTVSKALGVAVLPTTLFYSADGKLLYRHVGGVSAASLDYALEQMAARDLSQ